jgi:hypothetical protein
MGPEIRKISAKLYEIDQAMIGDRLILTKED